MADDGPELIDGRCRRRLCGGAPSRLATAFSIGLKSGEWGWKEEQLRTDRLDGFADGGALMRRQVIHDEDIAEAEPRSQDLLGIGEEPVAGHRAVKDHRRGHAGQASALTNVVDFQWPCGILALSRWPRGARPCNHAILVLAPISSMNTRRRGSRSSWPSNHASRRLRTSGRSCSAACPDYF